VEAARFREDLHGDSRMRKSAGACGGEAVEFAIASMMCPASRAGSLSAGSGN
jgi:hypothetical protein